MIGKNPKQAKAAISVPVAFVVRDFRGSRLFLASLHTGNGMRWSSDKTQAMALEPGDALSICERASRHWGTACAVIDAQGNMARRPAGDAATNAREILAQLTSDGRVDRKAFIGEMQSRSLEHYGKPLDAFQVTLLGRIVAAYEAELVSAS